MRNRIRDWIIMIIVIKALYSASNLYGDDLLLDKKEWARMLNGFRSATGFPISSIGLWRLVVLLRIRGLLP